MARPSRFSPEVRDRAVRMVLEHGAVMLGEDAGTHAWMLSRRNLPPRLHNNSSRKRDHPTGENAPHHRAVLFGQEWTGLQGERVWLCYPAADVLTQRSANEAAAPRGECDGTGARTAIRVRDGAPDEPDPTPRGVRGAHGALPSLAVGDLPTCAHNRGSGRWKRPGGFRARPAANALWESKVFYAVGSRARCDDVRAALATPTETCRGAGVLPARVTAHCGTGRSRIILAMLS
jgi:hypothetical protein